ncbi:ABC transporter substrate-binding protein [Paenibacillus oceani]|uniref:Extracellular solute-binding protein n=1 Tax=Paenibacillus oceani TaxID=2772510 RepID=A0A927H2B8_9BACL|nr:extracellular solute-binding protein [Paenibacillus oceani]MBD2866086.1 extracellular solute-binding protein [Paenibacillus oceani]
MITKMKHPYATPVLWTVLFAVALGGCGKQDSETEGQKTEIDTTPVVLRVLVQQPMSDEDAKALWIEPLAKQYPHITLELIRGKSVESLIAANETPDLIYTFNGNLPGYNLNDLLMDMTPLIEKHGIDLSRFEAPVMDSIRVTSKEGSITALPFTQQFNALYYNKSLFDRFGVDYPRDGMYWDETVELAKKLSRSDSGVQYHGLDIDDVVRVSRPFGVLTVDPVSEKASLDQDNWRKAFDLAREVYTIPNNFRPKNVGSRPLFLKEQTLAMMGTVNMLAIGLEEAMKNGLDWDLVQYPSYRELPNVATIVDAHIFAVTKTSKHKDQAIQALKVFTSDEVQMLSARKSGRLTVLRNAEVKQALGKDMPFLEGKNLEAAFKSKAIAAPAFSRFEGIGVGLTINSGMYDYIAGKDINTVIRETEEKINQQIASQKK